MHKYQLRKKALIAVALTISLAAASCGSDDDTDSTVDTGDTGDTTSSAVTEAAEDNEAPEWATNPTAVRDSGLLAFNNTEDGRYVTLGLADDESDNGQPTTRACSVRRDVVAVWGPQPDMQSYGIDEIASSTPFPELPEMSYYTLAGAGADLLAIAAGLLEQGFAASPVYEMFPTPGRMYFPGTLPVPADPPNAPITDRGTTDSDATVNVTVIDTGALDNQPRTSVLGTNGNDLVGGNAELPLVVGHGAFVSGVVLQQAPSADIESIRIPFTADGEASTGNSMRFDEGDLLQAVSASKAENRRIFNLSAGFGHCEVNGRELFSVTSLALVVKALGDDSPDAETSNSPEAETSSARLTYPAAFADPSWIDAKVVQLLTSCESFRDEDACDASDVVQRVKVIFDADNPTYEAISDQVIAVGASDMSAGEPYSTTGGWVTTYVPGCHQSWYPAGEIDYPATGNNAEVPGVIFEDHGSNNISTASWCGSSFAAAMVSGKLAEEIANDRTLTAQELKRIACLADEGAAPSSSATTATTTSAPDVSRC